MSAAAWQPAGFVYADEVGHVPLAITCSGSVRSSPACGSCSGRSAARQPARPGLAACRSELVRLHGDDTLAFFKFRRDIHYLFDADAAAFLAYRVEGGVLLCSGDPVGRPPRFRGSLRQRWPSPSSAGFGSVRWA